MALEIISGDILKIDTEAIVIPANTKACTGRLLDKKVYVMAGYDEMMAARKAIGEIPVGKAEVTSAFSLKAKYVIHTVTPPWTGGFSEEPRLLTNCFCNSLMRATELQVKSIAFPLLCSGSNRMPILKAKTIAEDTINGWLRSHKSTLQVYLVILPDDMELLKEHHDANICTNQLSPLEKQREAKLREYLDKYPSKSNYDFLKERMRDYLRTRIVKNADLCRAISYDQSNISKLMKGQTQRPNKKAAIAMAIYMKLSEEERKDFMCCAEYSYPLEQLDFKVEELLNSGITDFQTINELLYAENPEWLLTNVKDGAIQTKKKQKKQYEK